MHARIRVTHRWYEVELRSLAEIPVEIVRGATPQTLIWDAFTWGMVNADVLDHAPMWRIRQLWDEWQKDSGIEIGQILQLIGLIDKHPEALEADLIRQGLRLRNCPTPEFNWRDLLVIVQYSDVNSAIVDATDPDRAGWDKETMLLASAVDALNWLVWAKTERASKGGEPPALIKRPGVKTKEVRPGSKTKPLPLSEIRKRAGLDQPRNDDERRKKINAAFK